MEVNDVRSEDTFVALPCDVRSWRIHTHLGSSLALISIVHLILNFSLLKFKGAHFWQHTLNTSTSQNK
jgi:hypothetical protein